MRELPQSFFFFGKVGDGSKFHLYLFKAKTFHQIVKGASDTWVKKVDATIPQLFQASVNTNILP